MQGEGTTSAMVDGRLLIQRGDVVLRDGTDVFVPAKWQRHREIVVYSKAGYESRTWTLPEDWRHVRQIDIHQIGQDGRTFVARQRVVDGQLTLSLPAGTAVSITPSH